MSTKITITVGIELRSDGTRISLEEAAEMRGRVESAMLDQCGGYTVSLAKGGWRDSGSDWRESVLIFTVTVPIKTELSGLKILARGIAAQIRDIFQQQCVALETQPVNFELV